MKGIRTEIMMNELLLHILPTLVLIGTIVLFIAAIVIGVVIFTIGMKRLLRKKDKR